MKNKIFKQLVSFATGFALVFAGIMPAMADGTAKLYFNPSSVSVAPNTEFTVGIKVDTGTDATVGVDAIIEFDTSKLEYIGYDDSGSDFKQSGMVIETASSVSLGKVVLSGLIINASPKTGDLTVATARFRTKAVTGTTTLNYAFDVLNKDDTTNNFSNVAPAPGSGMIDLLDSVESATITISDVPVSAPTIASINPETGSFNTASRVSITGTNFSATQGNGKVMLGTKNMTVITWADTLIVADFPAEPTLTATSGPRQVKVVRDDGAIATKYGFTYMVGTQPPPPPPTPGGSMYISSIYPASGSKMAPNEITIYGGGFGAYTDVEKNRVFIGLQEITGILDWNDNRILIQVPPRPELTSKTTLSVKVYNANDEMAEYLGYTYLLSPLPGTGPEHWMWAGIVATALAASWVVYRKLNTQTEVVNEFSDYQF